MKSIFVGEGHVEASYRNIIKRYSMFVLILIILASNIPNCYASEYWTLENVEAQLYDSKGFSTLSERFDEEKEKLQKDKPELFYYVQGVISIAKDDYNTAYKSFEQSLSCSKRADNSKIEIEALKKLIWISEFYGESGGLIDYGSRLLGLSEKYNDTELELYAYDAIAMSYYYMANDEKVFEYLERMLSLANESGRKDFRGVYNTVMGNIYYSYQDYDTAQGYYEKASNFYIEKELKNFAFDIKLYSQAQTVLMKNKFMNGKKDEDLSRINFLISEAKKSYYNTPTLYHLYLIKGQIEREYHLIARSVESFEKSKEQLDKIQHIDTTIIFDGYIKSLLARAYYENGSYKESADIFVSNAVETEDSDYYKNIDETTSKLRAFQEKELNGRIQLLTELQDAQDKKLQYQRTILSLLALIIAILLFAFIMITRENKKVSSLKDKLYIQSITDSLTGIFNRRRILEALNNEAGDNSIIALADVDDFKKINDTLGHLVGDEVLKKVAETMKNSVRDKDEVGRYGGEEFIIIIKDTDLNNAIKVIERIRKSVESLEWEHEDLKTSISVGVAEKKSLSAEEIFREVDKLMHEAKKKGKNRVIYR